MVKLLAWVQLVISKKGLLNMQKSIEALQLFFIIGLLLIIQVNQLPGQSPLDSAARAPIDVNILFNYYTQEGNNSAVTGGVGC